MCAASTFTLMEGLSFPLLLLDECSQMTEPASMLPMARYQFSVLSCNIDWADWSIGERGSGRAGGREGGTEGRRKGGIKDGSREEGREGETDGEGGRDRRRKVEREGGGREVLKVGGREGGLDISNLSLFMKY